MKIICKCTVTRFGGGCAFILLRYIPINSVVHVVHSLSYASFWCAFISSIILPPFLHLLLPTSQALPSHFNYLTACCLNFHWSLCLPIYQSTHLACIQLTLAGLSPPLFKLSLPVTINPKKVLAITSPIHILQRYGWIC